MIATRELDLDRINARLKLEKMFGVGAYAGAEQGISTEGGIVTFTTDGRDISALWNEFQATVAIQNERRQGLIDFLTFPVASVIEDIPQLSSADFEEASELGEPKGIRVELNYFSLAFDFRDYDLAQRFTWKFLRDASAAQVEAIHQGALEADNRLIFTKVMKTIFNSANVTTDIRNAAYTVYKFYNNDGTVPPSYNGVTFPGTHNHYLTSGAATVDSGDVEAMIGLLREHGYSLANGTQIILMVNPAQANAIRTWRANVVNANAATALYDFIPAPGQPPLIVPNVNGLVGQQPPSQIAGLTVIGQYGPAMVVEEDYIPAGYMFIFGTGGVGGLNNPVGFREHANPAYRGLRLIPGNRQGYPLIDSFYSRGFGTGIRQRGGGAVMQVTAAGSYTTPTIYL